MNKFRSIGDLLVMPDGSTPPNSIIIGVNVVVQTITYLTNISGYYTITIVNSNSEYMATVLEKKAFDILRMIN